MDTTNKEINLIYPNIPSINIEPNADMLDQEKDLFNQAKNIFDHSPKSAGALLRVVLESILKRKFNIKEEKTYLGEILNKPDVKEKLGEFILSICNACRLIGNDASHSGLLTYKNDDKEKVELFFKLINMITDKLITQPLKEKELLDSFNK